MIDDDSLDITSILVPTTITAAMITSVTANGVALPEDSAPLWSSGTTYAAGSRVHSLDTHRVYESVKAGNVAHDPTDITNQFNASGVPTWWINVGPTNKWAMLDGLISSKTAGASPLVITLAPGAFNGFALFGIDADAIEIEVLDSPTGDPIYTTGGAVTLDGSLPPDYYEYFFDPAKPQTQFIATGLQPYGSAQIKITLHKATGPAKLGMVTLGDLRSLGVPERGTRVTPRSYSYIAEDAYGNNTIKRRPSAVGLSIPVKVAYEDADVVLEIIQDLLDVPVAVIGSTAMYHNKLSTFGLVSGEMDYSTFPERTLNLTVKGFA